MAGRHLGCYGWDAAAWPGEITAAMTIPLARNASGHRIDEAGRLHQAAGVSYHKAHDAYVEAVAATVEAPGIVIGDLVPTATSRAAAASASAVSLEDLWDDDGGDGPSRVIQWREDRGWYSIWFSDSQAALGDYTIDLPGSLPLVAAPEKVAGAVLELLRRTPGRRRDAAAVPGWQMPAGYEADPPDPEGEGRTSRPGSSGR